MGVFGGDNCEKSFYHTLSTQMTSLSQSVIIMIDRVISATQLCVHAIKLL